MATIKFELLSNTENTPIYLRLSIKRGLTPRRKTGLFINPKNWSKEKALPKQTISDNKNLTTDLLELKASILKRYNDTSSKGTEVNGDWLKFNIDLHFNRVNENKQSDLLTDAIQDIIDNADIRKSSKGNTGLSRSRINAYKSLKKIITEYQASKKPKAIYKVKDVDVKWAKVFLRYLLDNKNYQQSYAIKKLADLKTVCNDASMNGIEASLQLKKIDSSKKNNENIIYLNPLELAKIENAVITNEALLNARKWLILGCNLGQRGGDLLKLNISNFITRNGYDVIELKQEKTGKNVTIPVLAKTKEILESGLPYSISIQKFNRHIKEVCKIAEIDDNIKGAKITVTEAGKGNKQKRKIDGEYPKHELIASHVCRRSFATNLYGELPTPLIMSITGHSSEKMLLNYIGKNSLDYAQQIADFYTLQAVKEKKNLR